MTDLQSWFLARQQQLAEKVGEPVLLTIRLCYDDWFEVTIQTFTDRWGMAAGREGEGAVTGALQTERPSFLVAHRRREAALSSSAGSRYSSPYSSRPSM